MKFLLAALLLASPALAWNQVGHKIIAAICYDELSDKARARVDAIIRQHPEYERWTVLARGKKERWAFINAAGWPDDIRGDARFYTDTQRDAVPTPTLPGYPDMKRHTNWHQIDSYFSPDGTPFPTTPTVPNIVTQLRALFGDIQGPNATYLLPWLEHLVGDVHNPLHSASRWVAWNKGADGRLRSDAGGNGVNVDGFTNLHTIWDDLLGNTDDADYIDWMERKLRKQFPAEKMPDLDPEHWSHFSFELARREVYKFPADIGSTEKPFRRTPEYVKDALSVARRQGALAGHRMAAVLNAQLK